jgi:hypothetical protein
MSEENKRIAIAFYEKLINEFDPQSAFALYGGESYMQYTPVIEDGREGLTKFISSVVAKSPMRLPTLDQYRNVGMAAGIPPALPLGIADAGAFTRTYPPGIAIRYALLGQGCGSVSRKSFMARRTSASLERKT